MEATLRNITDLDWVTLLLFGSLVCLVIAKGFFYPRFLNFIILPFNNKYITMYNKKEKLINWFHIFFTVFQLINFSLFLFFTSKILAFPQEVSNDFLYPMILVGLALFIVVKTALQLANGFVFSTNKTVTELVFKKLSYLNHSSLIMFIANVALVYIIKDSKVVVYLALFLIISINVTGWITVLRQYRNIVTGNFFYFILYLCTLEIAPFIIIGSYLKD